MKVLELVELEDGSATVKLDLSKEESELLIQTGFLTLLQEYVENEEKMRKVPALCKK